MNVSDWPELLAVYGPFVLSLLLLAPKGDWIARTKLTDILPADQTLAEEVLLTVDLIGRLEKLIDVVAFDVVLTYLIFIACLVESNSKTTTNVASGIILLIVYHAVLGFSSRLVYNDISGIGYPHLSQRFKVVLGFPIRGSAYLLLLTSGLAICALLCTAGFRWILLGRI